MASGERISFTKILLLKTSPSMNDDKNIIYYFLSPIIRDKTILNPKSRFFDIKTKIVDIIQYD